LHRRRRGSHHTQENRHHYHHARKKRPEKRHAEIVRAEGKSPKNRTPRGPRGRREGRGAPSRDPISSAEILEGHSLLAPSRRRRAPATQCRPGGRPPPLPPGHSDYGTRVG